MPTCLCAHVPQASRLCKLNQGIRAHVPQAAFCKLNVGGGGIKIQTRSIKKLHLASSECMVDCSSLGDPSIVQSATLAILRTNSSFTRLICRAQARQPKK
jgi:hypothetical protein